MKKRKGSKSIIADGVTYSGKLATRLTVTEDDLMREAKSQALARALQSPDTMKRPAIPPDPMCQALARALQSPDEGRRPANPLPLSTQIVAQRMEKILLLFELYEVGEGRWDLLTYKLACAHVPGFQLGKVKKCRVGRPTSDISAEMIRELVNMYLREHPGTDVITACRTLTAENGFLSFMTTATVRRRYYEGAALVCENSPQ
jgi:hypothetical protein